MDHPAAFRITPQGPYALAASARFLCGFTPGSGTSHVAPDGRLALGFLADDTWEPVAVSLAMDGDAVVGETDGGPGVAAQVARILSLDHDATPLDAIGARDPVVARLLAARPGFRPVCFPSAYEAAAWGVLAQRVSMTVAAGVRRRLSVATGTARGAFGATHHPAPAPRRLLDVQSFPGVDAERLARLHGVARAALDGELDTLRLRAMPHDDALARLRRVRGVGPWTAAHTLLRGCGVTDALPEVEPRVLRGVGEAYGYAHTPSLAELRAIGEAWRPLRTWVSVLVVSSLQGTARWHGPEPRGASPSA